MSEQGPNERPTAKIVAVGGSAPIPAPGPGEHAIANDVLLGELKLISAQLAVVRSEGETRGLKQDRAIEIVGEQVKSLGTAVVKIDQRVGRLEEERSGIQRHVSQTEEQVTAAIDGEKRSRVLLEGDVEDLRMGLKAVTSALQVRVPNPDGSMPPGDGKKHKNAIEKQATLSKILVWGVGALASGGVLDKAGVFEVIHKWLVGH